MFKYGISAVEQSYGTADSEEQPQSRSLTGTEYSCAIRNFGQIRFCTGNMSLNRQALGGELNK